ncbi:2-hydroxyacid dehydrogenase [Eremomyces bilateralis CBS 781.70]|uniref:2-hydroxyacid dehydrogenase n=1 Tax=Eremomyces bilateralis CBS 781.70 TaxID=1392243 RepID=A0A6G1G260_9PEZI|nr:2-hydroxyacid dehydrogenase [Eremomyces bilateralis CBS 781.70]KAF1812144.1 2-hydroxyacid dehydrogenase [Eremomyces bilateralis CBS 781.70]
MATPKPEKLLCVLPLPAPPNLEQQMKEKHPEMDFEYIFHRFDTRNALACVKDIVPPEKFQSATVLVTLTMLPDPADCPNLELIHVFSAGTNHIANHPIFTNTKIPICTATGVHGPQIAEWVLMTLLAHNHLLPRMYEFQKKHLWERERTMEFHRVRDLVGQRIGVLGYGSIGRQIARVSKAMGMDVIAYTATPKKTPEARQDSGYIVPGTGDPDGSIPSAWFGGLDKDSLHNFLEQDIDVLVLSLPLTAKTRHLLGEAEFEILAKKQAFLVNISRGEIIDQPDLIRALEKGSLRGAALDVTDPEPLPKDDPLWDAPNILIAPHISGVGSAYSERAFQILDINLTRRAKGEKLINVVQRERGY